MPSRSEMLGNGSIRGQKSLARPGGFEPLQAIFSLACGPMGVLTAVVERATLPVFHAGQSLLLRRAVAFQLLRDNHPWHIGEAFEQLAKALLCCLLVAPTLDENVQDVVVLLHRTPQGMPFPMDREKYLIQVPFISWLRATTTQPNVVVLTLRAWWATRPVSYTTARARPTTTRPTMT
jgi:hypothetical protein